MNDFVWIMGSLLTAGILVLLVLGVGRSGKKKLLAVWTVVSDTLPEASISHRHGSEALVETDHTTYLIKAVPFHPEHELIVTNKTYWCVNDKPSQWRRSSKPNLIPGVAEFLSWVPETKKRIVRLGVIVPGCRNITFHINECDVVVVTPQTDVHGARLMRLADLAEYLRKAERK